MSTSNQTGHQSPNLPELLHEFFAYSPTEEVLEHLGEGMSAFVESDNFKDLLPLAKSNWLFIHRQLVDLVYKLGQKEQSFLNIKSEKTCN